MNKGLAIALAVILVSAIVMSGAYFLYLNSTTSGNFKINTFTVTNDPYINGSSNVPIFKVSAYSLKSAYISLYYTPVSNESLYLTSIAFQGNITLIHPISVEQMIEEMNLFGSPGYHHVYAKIFTGTSSVKQSKQIFTFPHSSLYVQYKSIDINYPDSLYFNSTGSLRASDFGEWLTISHGNQQTFNESANQTTYEFNFPGNYTLSGHLVNYNGSEYTTSVSENITVNNKPDVISIWATNLSYDSLFGDTTFDLHWNVSGGTNNSAIPSSAMAMYSNGTYYGQYYYFHDGLSMSTVTLNGSGPFNIYVSVNNGFYNVSSQEITIYG